MVNNMVLAKTINDKISEMFNFEFVPQLFMSLLVMLIVLIFAIIVGTKARHAKVDEKPKGIFFLGILIFQTIDNFTLSIMNKKYRDFTRVMIVFVPYIFICFIISLTGLPSPIVYLATPLSLALVVFFMVHGTAIKENHWGYFKRYVDPFPVFLPINLISMWAPTISLTFRLFGNAMSGFCIMNIVYFGLETLSNALFTGTLVSGAIGVQSIFLAPLVTPFLHLYFDIFSGCIQTLVFSMLTLIYVSQEQSQEDENQVIEEVVSN
ncbi:MAG: FoF1 ATP synthase subunit a [Bacilli bacterium]|jgi:F-type H+-transporting ATPase subunit a